MIATVLLVIALICFLVALIDWPPGQQVRLIAAGLFLWLLSILIKAGG